MFGWIPWNGAHLGADWALSPKVRPLPTTPKPRYLTPMATPAAVKVIVEALALTDEERGAVAEELLASLDPTQPDNSPEAAAAFKAELDRRWAAYQAGDEPSIPWSEVRERLRARRTGG